MDIGCTFSGVTDNDDADGVSALKVTQVDQRRRNPASDVLIDAVQSDGRIKDEQAGLEPRDGVLETGAIGVHRAAFAASDLLGTPIVFNIGVFDGAVVVLCANTDPGAPTSTPSLFEIRASHLAPQYVPHSCRWQLTLR